MPTDHQCYKFVQASQRYADSESVSERRHSNTHCLNEIQAYKTGSAPKAVRARCCGLIVAGSSAWAFSKRVWCPPERHGEQVDNSVRKCLLKTLSSEQVNALLHDMFYLEKNQPLFTICDNLNQCACKRFQKLVMHQKPHIHTHSILRVRWSTTRRRKNLTHEIKMIRETNTTVSLLGALWHVVTVINRVAWLNKYVLKCWT